MCLWAGSLQKYITVSTSGTAAIIQSQAPSAESLMHSNTQPEGPSEGDYDSKTDQLVFHLNCHFKISMSDENIHRRSCAEENCPLMCIET